jgi:hypothetical protein
VPALVTFGFPAGSAWGCNYGDDVPRYPKALIEIFSVLPI